MIDIKDKGYRPTLEEIGEYIANPVFTQFCSDMKTQYDCVGKTEYSSCSWMPGWNVKFKKAGKNLCTGYPQEGFFTIFIVAGETERTAVEAVLPSGAPEAREVYEQTEAGNGQKWLMFDVEDAEEMYRDIFRLIGIRRRAK